MRRDLQEAVLFLDPSGFCTSYLARKKDARTAVLLALRCFILLLLIQSTATDGSAPCAPNRQNQECTSKPPNGTWLMSHYTLFMGGPRMLYAQSVLLLNEVSENIYIGAGSGVFYYANVDSIDIYKGSLWYYHIGALFNPKTCMLSGIMVHVHRWPTFVDGIEYFYDGTGLSGRLVASAGSKDSPDRAVEPYFSEDNATYIAGPVKLPPLPHPSD